MGKEIVVYFDPEIDRDLIEHLNPYLKKKWGSSEIKNLMRRGLNAGAGGAVTYYQAPLMPATQTGADFAPDFEESDVDTVEAARRSQLSAFGGFDDES